MHSSRTNTQVTGSVRRVKPGVELKPAGAAPHRRKLDRTAVVRLEAIADGGGTYSRRHEFHGGSAMHSGAFPPGVRVLGAVLQGPVGQGRPCAKLSKIYQYTHDSS